MIRNVMLSAVLIAGCGGDRAAEPPARETRSASSDEAAAPADETHSAEAAPASATDEVYPLRQWMQANLARPVKTQDFASLQRSLDNLASMGPAEFGDWNKFAKAGASAAADKDIDKVRASCADCHQTYRVEYRAKLRTRPLPEMRSAR